MKKQLFIITLLASFIMISCKKSSSDVLNPAVTSNGIKVPTGFTWQNSRNINFTVTVTDTRFQSMAHSISIFDGSGNLLSKGSATTSSTFKSKVYISNQTLMVYVIKTSPDNSKVIQKVTIGTADVATSIGQ